MRLELQAPSACRGGAVQWGRSLGRVDEEPQVPTLRPHGGKRRSQHLGPWHPTQSRRRRPGQAERAAIQRGPAPAEQRPPSPPVSRRPARASHQAAGPSRPAPQPHLEARPPATGQLPCGRDGAGPCPVLSQKLLLSRSLPATAPSPHTGAEKRSPRPCCSRRKATSSLLTHPPHNKSSSRQDTRCSALPW